MNTLNRLIQGGVIAGFLILSSGCVVAPDGERDRVVREHDYDRHDYDRHDHDNDRYRDRDRDRRDHDERRCDDHDEHCRDR
jgi:hypothetical protein